MTDCTLCHGPHDPEFHAMNAELHGWYRAVVTRYLSAPKMPLPGPRPAIQTPKSEAVKSIGHVPRKPTSAGRPAKHWITTGWILQRQREGATHDQIAYEAKCGTALIVTRLRDAKGTPEWQALRVCACGESKKPATPACRRCVAKSKASSEYARLREIGKQREARA